MAPPLRYQVPPVRPLLLLVSLVAAFAGLAAADAPAANTQAPAQAARLSPAATEATNVVNAFMGALAGNQLETARQLMLPSAVILVNGNVIGTRDAYIDGPAKADAAALAKVQRELLRRDASADANTSLVLSEKRIRPAGAAESASEIVTETMVLARTPAGWKIAHIHWSNRNAR